MTKKQSLKKAASLFIFSLAGLSLIPRLSLAQDEPATPQSSAPTIAPSVSPAPLKSKKKERKKKRARKHKNGLPTSGAAAPNSSKTFNKEAEWKFLSSEPLPRNKKEAAGLAKAMSFFIAANPAFPKAPKAWALLASFHQAAKQNKKALMDYLSLIYEYPTSSEALEAQSNFLSLAKKTLGRHLKPGWQNLASPPQAMNKEERLASMLENIPLYTGGSLRKVAEREFRRFEVRFPHYPHSDDILMRLAQLFEADSQRHKAIIFFREVFSAYPESLHAPKAEFEAASLYTKVGEYKNAIGTYQKLIEDYPQSDRVEPALESLSALFSKLDQWTLAIQTDQQIIKLYPNTPVSKKAFKNAIKASSEMSDFSGEVSFLVAFADAFSQSRQAPIFLYKAAGLCYEKTRDPARAEQLYQRYLAYPGHWYDPASWWRRHRARHRLSVLSPLENQGNAPAASNS